MLFRSLQDFGGTIQPLPGFELTAGQMKIPTIAESLDPSSDLPLPERSILARTYGDKRQLGLQASYKEVKWKITSMYSNGGSANTDDTTTAKDVFVRVEFNPFSGLSFGGWVGANDFIFSDNGKWGLNFRWKGESEMARFELAHSDDTVSGAKKKSDGYVAEVGYSVMSQLQPVLRFERFFSDSSNTDGAKAITLEIGRAHV